jgi:hypothetical protein
VSILSPLEPPRFATITLADVLAPRGPAAKGKKAPVPSRALSDAELGFSLDMAVVTGAVDKRVMVALGADQCRWLATATGSLGANPSSFTAFGSFPTANPILTHWSVMLADAWSSALSGTPLYLDAPAVACEIAGPVTEKAGVKLRTEAGLLFLRTTSSGGSADARRLAGLVASRLLAESSVLHSVEADEVNSVLLAPTLVESWTVVTKDNVESRDFKDWSADSMLELQDDLLRRAIVLIPISKANKTDYWWRLEAGTMEPIARGPAGWLIRWRDEGYPDHEVQMPSVELLRALAAIDAPGTVGFFIGRNLLKTGASPLASLLAERP